MFTRVSNNTEHVYQIVYYCNVYFCNLFILFLFFIFYFFYFLFFGEWGCGEKPVLLQPLRVSLAGWEVKATAADSCRCTDDCGAEMWCAITCSEIRKK